MGGWLEPNQYYYSPLYKEFDGSEYLVGVFNIDLQRRSVDSENTSVKSVLYYPKYYLADYDSVVNPVKVVNLNASETTSDGYNYAYNGNIYKYMENNAKKNVARVYFTALGRERYCTYKVNRPIE